MQKKMESIIDALVLLIGLSVASAAESDKPTKGEIAKELANPDTALTGLKFQNQYFSFDGDLPRLDDEDMYKLFFQPTLPFTLENAKTLWVRSGVPFVVDQPVFDTGSRRLGADSGLGDSTLDVQYGTTLEDGFLWSVGLDGPLAPYSRKTFIIKGSKYHPPDCEGR
jgi:hypothetical protein